MTFTDISISIKITEIFKKYIFYLFTFGYVGSLLLYRLFSLVVANRGYSVGAKWGVRASHCRVFFCCGAWALGCVGSVVALLALQHRLSSCGAWALLLQSVWRFPGPGSEPTSLHWQVGSLPLSPPGKPQSFDFDLL